MENDRSWIDDRATLIRVRANVAAERERCEAALAAKSEKLGALKRARFVRPGAIARLAADIAEQRQAVALAHRTEVYFEAQLALVNELIAIAAGATLASGHLDRLRAAAAAAHRGVIIGAENATRALTDIQRIGPAAPAKRKGIFHGRR